ncbi:TetR/AcrR family transcriptional regulator [Pimelobacter simplex]|uniref:TetR/AcrR family transcriptional regulator n=1 Tax=Nocardioides simplex TaxID=2045 RepID=UPI003AAF14E4
METPPEPTTPDEFWATPQVADFLGISRQAINRQVRTRKLLGAPGPGVTLFPAWQFDAATRSVRPEVAELLATFGEDVEPALVAQWSVTELDGIEGLEGASGTPADLLLAAGTKDAVLQHARELTPAALVASTTAEGGDEGAGGTKVAQWVPQRAGAGGPQHQILLAAADLFARKGPAKVSLREVAAAADVPYGLIHRFYGTKENLLVAVMQLLVSYGGDRLSGEQDIYRALEISFGADADSGQFGRMLTWAIFEGTPPERLLGDARSHGYRTQIDALWEAPVAPAVRADFDSNVLASLIALIGSVWDVYEPYLTRLAERPGSPRRSPDDVREEITDMLKVLIYATRPDRPEA